MIKKITTIFFTVLLCFISYDSFTSGNNPDDGNTNAPISSSTAESNCTGCHSGSLITSGSNWNNLTLTSNFTGNGYIPDSSYTIKIAYSQSGIGRWGFQATVIDGSYNMAGSISSSSSRVNKTTSSVSGKSREYAEHTATGTASTSTNNTDWTFTWKAPSKNVGAVTFYVCVNAANGDNTNSGDQIYSKSFTISPSNLLPVAKATIASTTTCIGTSVTFDGTQSQGATSYQWTFPSTATPSSSTDPSPVVKFNQISSTAAVSLVVKNKYGVSQASTINMNVTSKPPISIVGATSYTICKGDSVKLATLPTSTTYQYTWTPHGDVSPNVWAKDSNNYTVTIKDSKGCVNTAGPVSVRLHPRYTASISRDVTNDTVCFERPVKVVVMDSSVFKEFFYYNQSGMFLQTNTNPQTFQFSGSTQITARGKDAKGCLSAPSNMLNFVVKSPVGEPKASCTDKTTASFEINWAAVNKSLGYQVSLDSGKSWINPSSGKNGLEHRVLGFPPNTDIQVWVKALDIFPCYESVINKVICGSIPCSPLSYELEYDKEICKGKDINFKVRNLNTKHYSLSVDNGKGFKDTIFNITSDFSRTYKFELTDSNNLTCPTIKRDATVKVWEIPSMLFTSNSSQNIFCEGDPAMFSMDAKGMQEYNYFLNSVSKQKSNIPTWTLTSPKNLDTVWVVVKNGTCVDTTDKIKIGVKPLPVATFTHTFAGRTATFTPTENGNTIYKWSFGDGKDTIAKNPTHTYTGSATTVWVKLSITDPFGCTSSDSMEINVPASISKTLTESGIKLFPQPAGNNFNVEIPAGLINAEIRIADNTGRIIFKTTAEKNVTEINSSAFPVGLYIITVQKGNSTSNGKLIINR